MMDLSPGSNSANVSCLPLLVFPVLHQEYVQYFKHVLGRSVSWGDRLEFINGWYILLIISDAFTIIGSFIKIGIESKARICSTSIYQCLFFLLN